MNRIKNFIKYIPNKLLLTIITLLLLIYAIIALYLSSIILLFTEIETFWRIILIIVILILTFIFILSGANLLLQNKIKKIIPYFITVIIFGIIQLTGAYYIDKLYSSINKISKEEITYSTSIVTLIDSDLNKIEDLKNKKIGIISNKDSIDGYIISKEIIDTYKLDKNNTFIEYDEFILMLSDLYNKVLDAIFISSNYVTMFSAVDQFENISSETKIIFSLSKKMKKEGKNNVVKKKLTDPFTLLIMGVDSKAEDIHSGSAFNGDSLMLITFNPNTLNATILSIPRDSYVPIMCLKNKAKDKITHAAWYGEKCMIDTIENFTDINIDYYIKTNFKGLVRLVDTLGGIEVDVPITFCEQNSNRQWGNKTIYVKKGLQTLNGEQALALARHREDLKRCGEYYVNNKMNDIKRGLNQQLVLKAIVNKAKEIKNINKVYDILNIVEKNVDTNMTTSQILSFYNIFKDIVKHNKMPNNNEILSFQRLYLSGYDQYIYDDQFRKIYYYIPYNGSIQDIVEAMKINLNLKTPELIKTFSFSINDPYELKLIGKGPYSEKRIAVVPDFTKNTKEFALNWGTNNNIKITFNIIESNDDDYHQDQIIEQNIPPNSLLSRINTDVGIILTIVNKTSSISEKINCTLSENEEHEKCIVPNFIDKSITDVDNWLNSIIYNFIATKSKETTTDPLKNSIVFEQNIPAGSKVIDLTGTEFIIKYYLLEE